MAHVVGRKSVNHATSHRISSIHIERHRFPSWNLFRHHDRARQSFITTRAPTVTFARD
eukprot:COSAG02_NODE_2053_length_9994_cov_7.402628_8_plen_58_part_00